MTSSLTPANEENSCKTPSICTETIEAPCNEDNNILLNELKKKASLEKENLPLEITDPWPITGEMKTPKIEDFPLDKLMQNIDQDRMDIFDTIIRTIINGSEIPFVNAVMLLRDWERVIRTQLVKSTSPGHLFSPLELDDNF